jgi:hypothetical protein
MFDDTIYIPGNRSYSERPNYLIKFDKVIKNIKINKMKELVCTNPKNYKLTLDKKYLVVEDEGETVKVINDNNRTVRYYKDLFQEVEEEVIPEPEPVIVRTEQDLIDSITSDDLDTTYIDFNNETITIENCLSILNNNNEFSCGIKNITNIGDQIDEIYNTIAETANVVGEDLELLIKTVIKYHFKNYIKYHSNNGYDAGIYLMSCNINGNGLNEEVVDILNEISDFNTEPELNPNSGNKIMLWGFYKSNLDN